MKWPDRQTRLPKRRRSETSGLSARLTSLDLCRRGNDVLKQSAAIGIAIA